MGIDPKIVSAKDLEENFSVHYRIPKLYSRGDINKKDQNFNYWLNTYYYLSPDNNKQAIDFVYNFLSGKFKNHKLQVLKEISPDEDYINEQIFYRDYDCNIARDKDDVLKLIEERIEQVIKANISLYTHTSLFSLPFGEMSRKIKFIDNNRNSFKNNVEKYVSVEFMPLFENEHEQIMIPNIEGLLNGKENKKEFLTYELENNEVVSRTNNIFIAELTKVEHEGKTLRALNLNVKDHQRKVISIAYSKEGSFVAARYPDKKEFDLLLSEQKLKDVLINKVDVMSNEIKEIKNTIKKIDLKM